MSRIGPEVSTAHPEETFFHRAHRDCLPELTRGDWCSVLPVTDYCGPGLYLIRGGADAVSPLIARVHDDAAEDRLICVICTEAGQVPVPMSERSFGGIVLGVVSGKITYFDAEAVGQVQRTRDRMTQATI